jgi:hypothetical protein
MLYSFWDYFFGAVILLCFAVPIAGAILIQIGVFLTAMFGSALGLGNAPERGLTIKLQPHDMDEDY